MLSAVVSGSIEETTAQQQRGELYPKKIMLSVWRDIQGIVHYELLDNNQIIT